MQQFDYTICWDCKNAVGTCSWSDSGKPVKGWTAEPTEKKSNNSNFKSFIVRACPEFEADARDFGLKRLK